MGKGNYKIYDNLALLSQIGIMIAVPIVGGVYIGKFLDDKFGTNGILLIICIIIGTITGFYELMRVTLKKSQKDFEKSKREREERRK